MMSSHEMKYFVHLQKNPMTQQIFDRDVMGKAIFLFVVLCRCVVGVQGVTERMDIDPLLRGLDERSGVIQDVVADFEQHKYTSLLDEPIVSSGRVSLTRHRSRWDTDKPERSVIQRDIHTL